MIKEDKDMIKPIDYEGLRKKAMELISEFSSDSWTDYNTHDPGITIMEILCFALTELGLRADIPIKDLIAKSINEKKAGLYPSHDILTNKPVTKNDYRKLLIDIDGVKNAWLNEIKGHHNPIYKESIDNRLSWISSVEEFYHCHIKDVKATPFDYLEPYLYIFIYVIEQQLLKKCSNNYILLTSINFRQFFIKNNGLKEVEISFTNGECLKIYRNEGNLIFDEENFSSRNNFNAFYGKTNLTPMSCEYDSIRKLNEDEIKEMESLIDTLKEKYINVLSTDFYKFFYKYNYLKSLILYFDDNEQSFLKVFKNIYNELSFSSHMDKELICRGYWQVDVELEEDFPKDSREIKLAKIRNKLNKNRNLCELFPVVNIVEDEYVMLCLDIEISLKADVEEVLSNVVYRLDRFISPDIHFYSLKQMKEKKLNEEHYYSVEDIFNGPLLKNGFIDDNELAAAFPKKTLFASDLINEIMDVDEVIAVKNILMSSYHTDENGNLIPVEMPSGDTWQLPLDISRSTKLLIHHTVVNGNQTTVYNSKFIAFKGLLPYQISSQQLMNNINVLKAKDLPLPFKKEDLIEKAPSGQQMDLDFYYSIRNHFPKNYALKDDELKASESDDRKAKVMQLRAFLLFFDQILCNSFKQLSEFGKLLSFDSIQQTYFNQLSETLDAVKSLLTDDSPSEYLEKINEYSENKYVFQRRRNRFLDHLLARFGEEYYDYNELAENVFGTNADQHLIQMKERFLNNINTLQSERASAENIFATDWISGLEYRLRNFFGMSVNGFHVNAHILFHDSNEYLKNFNQSLTEENNAGEGKSHYFVISNNYGDFLKSNSFVSEEKRNNAIKCFYTHLKMIITSINDDRKELINLLMKIPDKVDFSNQDQIENQVLKTINLNKTQFLRFSNNKNRIKLLKWMFFKVKELNEKKVDLNNAIKNIMRNESILINRINVGRNEIIKEIFKLDFLDNSLKTNIRKILSKKLIYNYQQDELIESICKELNEISTENQKKKGIKELLLKNEQLLIEQGELGDISQQDNCQVEINLTPNISLNIEKIFKGNLWKFCITINIDSLKLLLNSTKEFKSEHETETAIYKAIEYLLDMYYMDKMLIFEHILLLEKNKSLNQDQLLPICNFENTALSFDPFSFCISIVLPGETKLNADPAFRRYIEKLIREMTPSHIFPRICWVNHKKMDKFEEAYQKWQDAYVKFKNKSAKNLDEARSDLVKTLNELETIYCRSILHDCTSDLVKKLNELETIYGRSILHDCTSTSSESTKPAVVLGSTYLGSINGD